MIATGRHERCVVAEPHDLVEPEHAVIERERAIDVGDFQVHVADAGAGGNAVVLHWLKSTIPDSTSRTKMSRLAE